MKQLKTFDSSYFIGKSYFKEDGTQNYLVFQSLNKYFKVIAITNYVSSWKSKGLSAETTRTPAISDNILTPTLKYYGTKRKVKFTGSCLKQPKISYNHRTTVNIYIVYGPGASSARNNDPTLKKMFIWCSYINKYTDLNKYGYSGYEIGFDRRSNF